MPHLPVAFCHTCLWHFATPACGILLHRPGDRCHRWSKSRLGSHEPRQQTTILRRAWGSQNFGGVGLLTSDGRRAGRVVAGATAEHSGDTATGRRARAFRKPRTSGSTFGTLIAVGALGANAFTAFKASAITAVGASGLRLGRIPCVVGPIRVAARRASAAGAPLIGAAFRALRGAATRSETESKECGKKGSGRRDHVFV